MKTAAAGREGSTHVTAISETPAAWRTVRDRLGQRAWRLTRRSAVPAAATG